MTVFLSSIESVSASSIVNRALRIVNDIGEGETATAEDAANTLEALNGMIDSWRNERLMIPVLSDDTIHMSPGTQDYTIGATGGTVSTRPIHIVSAYCRMAGIDYPVDVIPEESWAMIGQKSVAGNIVSAMRYRATLPDGTISVWPIPSAAAELGVISEGVLDKFVGLASQVYLQPGMKRALEWNLAIEIAPEFDFDPSKVVIAMANESKRAIKRTNRREAILRYDGIFSTAGLRHANAI